MFSNFSPTDNWYYNFCQFYRLFFTKVGLSSIIFICRESWLLNFLPLTVEEYRIVLNANPSLVFFIKRVMILFFYRKLMPPFLMKNFGVPNGVATVGFQVLLPIVEGWVF